MVKCESFKIGRRKGTFVAEMSTKVKAYREMQFSAETPHADFYTYSDVKDLYTKCEAQKHDIIKCRTVGILQSQYGHFHLYDLDSSGVQTESSIQVSVKYLKSPLKSTVLPYPVQVFGTLQWIDDKPILFIKILQVLTIPTALRYKDIMSTISKQHLAEKELQIKKK